MTTTASASLWATLEHTPARRQREFLRYLTASLVDLAVLGLFVEYWEHVVSGSFTIILLAAVLLQVLLKLTIALEHRVAAFFNARPGGFARFMRFFTAWLVLFGSKFAILEALDFAFGDSVSFEGVFHGIVWLIITVVTMVIAEEIVVRIYRKLA